MKIETIKKCISVDIFAYTDYTKYLQDFLEIKESSFQKLYFSHQALASRLGLKHKVQVFRMIHGERKHLPESLISKWCEVLSLDERETEYFKALVVFREAQTLEAKNLAYEALHKVIKPVSKHALHKPEFEYLKNWYGAVIRELLTMEGGAPSAEEISKKLKPKVSVAEVEATIENIKALGLICENGLGGYKLNHQKLSISETESALAARNYQQKHYELIPGAQNRCGDYPNRFVCATFGASEEGASIISAKIHEMVLELSDLMAHLDKEKNQVYQLNVQMFPLSEKFENGGAVK